MWANHRIACLTYHKHPAAPWSEELFEEHEVPMPSGEVIEMKLCEMGSRIGSGEKSVWVREVRKLTESGHQTSKLRYHQARFAELTMHPETEDNGPKYREWLKKKSDLLEDVQDYENELKTVKEKIKGIKKHITWGDLPEKDKFLRLLPGRKRLMDTIRMIAYRAETAMVGLLRGPTVDSPQARRLL